MEGKVIQVVESGDWVKVGAAFPWQETRFRFVSEEEAHLIENGVSVCGALAQALAGARIGERFLLHVEGHPVELTILDFGRNHHRALLDPSVCHAPTLRLGAKLVAVGDRE